ncbi:ARM repeat-containing protein [Nadsonia fulvescens var. elongata DSM 6958]|uniref:ARM repeat-containing protein n=1 Tax=Nadsonia fulvescens var. elongata DSM 6958 TaxID=857566 RepID=A0A1E3PTF1_9ASCO|nr:ARM repeat-containing protein [Nadsonia fulvescens var. elongata DSM 6958]
MSSNVDFTLPKLMEALSAMYTGSDKAAKQVASTYLEEFQKSSAAWDITHIILNGSDDYSVESKLFAAQTLRSKIIYDLHQVPNEAREQLKDSMIQLLITYKSGPKIIAVQLSVALANLALQYISWKNVVQEMVSKLSGDIESCGCLLEFLRVLPEELSDMKRTSLSDIEFHERTEELLSVNASHVLELLLTYLASSGAEKNRSLVFKCFNSWLKEIAISDIIDTPLIDLIFQALTDEDTFEPAIDCICSVIRETRDVNDNMHAISQLYPRILALRPNISKCKDDPESFAGYTRLFSEAGESWHMCCAKLPNEFRGLVEAIAECTAFDEDLEVVQYTFYFWYSLKQMIVMENYRHAREEFKDIYLALIGVIIQHLHYPLGEKQDLFDGDREQEDKFRSFRHEMGDVLKDCCSVVGSSQALQKPYEKIYVYLQAKENGENIPWQYLEAPLFSLRAMAREVELSEDEVLPNIMKLLVQLPEHEKIRYAATLVLGRYTEWTAKHPEYLEFQLNYITGGFSNPSADVVSAAAQALMHFCQDCNELLTNFIDQLFPFYENVAQSLDIQSLEGVTEGIAHVIHAQPLEGILAALQAFGRPILARLQEKALTTGDETVYTYIADHIELITILVKYVRPHVPHASQLNPLADFVMECWPVARTLLGNHGQNTYVSERVCKFIRVSLHSCTTSLEPTLPEIVESLVVCFEQTHFGCYLWVSGSVVREFANEESTEAAKEAVWQFVHRQIVTFFRHLNETQPKDVPNLVEDFFHLMGDVLMFLPFKFVDSDLFVSTLEAAMASLALEQEGTVLVTLHFLRDLFSYGFGTPVSSVFSSVPSATRNAIINMAVQQGAQLSARIFSGLIYTFPRDCVTDASGLLLTLIQLVPNDQALNWISSTLSLLPEGTVGEEEKTKLLTSVSAALTSGDFKRIRSLVKDFTSWYSRRNVNRRSRMNGISGLSGNFNYDN